jgi:hypothetical protein
MAAHGAPVTVVFLQRRLVGDMKIAKVTMTGGERGRGEKI